MILHHYRRTALFGVFALAVFMAAAASSSSQAALILGDPVLLSTLHDNPNGVIIVGDKRFSNFNYTAVGDMPGADRVNVTPIRDDLGHLGVRFTGPFIDLVGNGGSDATITFQVDVLGSGMLINDVHLSGNPNVLGDGGSASVTETFAGQNILLDIYDDFGNLKLIDWADLAAPVRTLHVHKDILLFGQTGSATISIIDQTFSQIPEPAAALLAIIGLVAGLGVRRRAKLA